MRGASNLHARSYNKHGRIQEFLRGLAGALELSGESMAQAPKMLQFEDSNLKTGTPEI